MTGSDVEVAIAAASAGAEVIRARYGQPVARYAKEGLDFATEADLEAERAILDVIRAARPGDAFMGEEAGLLGDPTADRTWLVDPLCGTLNFAAGTPLVAVNVALREVGRTVAAAVVDPIAVELFWTDGARARLGDQPLSPSAVSRLVDLDLHGYAAWVGRVVASPAFARHFGHRATSTSLALTWVATGRRAAYIWPGDLRNNVHFAAGLALCVASGCVVTGLQGEPVDSGPVGLVAAADRETHDLLLAIVASVGGGEPVG
ncbi:MAG: inositol monophosphatase family protein [Nocardioides sp.]